MDGGAEAVPPEPAGSMAMPSSPSSPQAARTLVQRGPTIARLCKVTGTGLSEGSIMQPASFTIEAIDYTGARQQQGGDAFFVAIRCNAQGTRARAKITDNNDGSYTIVHKPPSAGKYTIAISLLGEPLPGSPFACVVTTPTPKAENCLLQGDALTKATARKHEYFRISFRVSTNALHFGSCTCRHRDHHRIEETQCKPLQRSSCCMAAVWLLRDCCVAAEQLLRGGSVAVAWR